MPVLDLLGNLNRSDLQPQRCQGPAAQALRNNKHTLYPSPSPILSSSPHAISLPHPPPQVITPGGGRGLVPKTYVTIHEEDEERHEDTRSISR